jgi:hypothetical protein
LTALKRGLDPSEGSLEISVVEGAAETVIESSPQIAGPAPRSQRPATPDPVEVTP